MRHNFDTAQLAHDFAYEKNVPYNRVIDLKSMNSRMLTGLRIRREWILGIHTEYQQTPESSWLKVDREYISLDSFRLDYQDLTSKVNTRITGFYCYQLGSPESIIHLENLSACPLSTQLSHYTGDSYNVHDFHNEDDESNLTAGGVIVHRETKQRFFVPAADVCQFT